MRNSVKIGIAVVLAVVGGWVFWPQTQQEPEPVVKAGTEGVAETAVESTGAPAAEPEPEAAAKAPEPELWFDLVRVSADGQLVIAGGGPPGQIVEILQDGVVVGTIEADASGKFASVLEIGTSDVERVLLLRTKSGAAVGSAVTIAPAATEIAAAEAEAAAGAETVAKAEAATAKISAAEAKAAAEAAAAEAKTAAAKAETAAASAAMAAAKAEAEANAAASAATDAAAATAETGTATVAETEPAAQVEPSAAANAETAAAAEAAARKAIAEAAVEKAAADAAAAAAEAAAEKAAAAGIAAEEAAAAETAAEKAAAAEAAKAKAAAAVLAAAEAAEPAASSAEPEVARVALSEPVIILPQAGAEEAPLLVKPGADGVTLLQPAAVEPAAGIVLDRLTYSPQGDLVAAGRGQPGSTVRVYANAKFLQEVECDESGGWEARIGSEIAAQALLLRFDEIDASGAVVSRLEAPFEYSPAATMQELRDRKIVVQKGDNLWTFAEQYYGQGVRYSVIFGANSGLIRDPDLIYPGQVFTVPELVNTQ